MNSLIILKNSRQKLRPLQLEKPNYMYYLTYASGSGPLLEEALRFYVN